MALKAGRCSAVRMITHRFALNGSTYAELRHLICDVTHRPASLFACVSRDVTLQGVIETGDKQMTNTIDQLSIDRAANFARFATNLRAFAARQEAKAPGRMSHVTDDVLKAATLAETASAAYAAGDKETAATARAAYAELCTLNSRVAHAQG